MIIQNKNKSVTYFHYIHVASISKHVFFYFGWFFTALIEGDIFNDCLSHLTFFIKLYV